MLLNHTQMESIVLHETTKHVFQTSLYINTTECKVSRLFQNLFLKAFYETSTLLLASACFPFVPRVIQNEGNSPWPPSFALFPAFQFWFGWLQTHQVGNQSCQHLCISSNSHLGCGCLKLLPWRTSEPTSSFTTLLASIVYCARLKHSTAFLSGLCYASCFSPKKIVNYSLFANSNCLSTAGCHWFNHIWNSGFIGYDKNHENPQFSTFIFKLMHSIN